MNKTDKGQLPPAAHAHTCVDDVSVKILSKARTEKTQVLPVPDFA